MAKFLGLMSTVLEFLSLWGFIGLLSLFYPVYWSQDTKFRHNGYDLVSLKPSGYFRVTYSQVRKFIGSI